MSRKRTELSVPPYLKEILSREVLVESTQKIKISREVLVESPQKTKISREVLVESPRKTKIKSQKPNQKKQLNNIQPLAMKKSIIDMIIKVK